MVLQCRCIYNSIGVVKLIIKEIIQNEVGDKMIRSKRGWGRIEVEVTGKDLSEVGVD